MLQGVEFTPLPKDVESSFEDSFGSVFSPFEDDDFEAGRAIFMGGTNGEKFGWDNFQALPSSPLGGYGGDLDVELEFFRSDRINEECKVAGPTLAELNDDHRSLSPLINPEMERLHRIATRTEGELSSSWDCSTSRKPQGYIALELTAENVERPRSIEIKKEPVASFAPNCEYNDRFENPTNVRQTERKPPSKPTWTLTQENAWRSTVEQLTPDQGKPTRMIVLPDRKLGLGSDDVNQMPKLVSAEMKGRLYEEREEGQTQKKVERNSEAETMEAEPNSPTMEEESADEEMDSDDDFDVGNHSQGAGLARNRKGRRGEHDDLSPNPRKLLEISRELDRLNKVIGDLKPIHQLPQNARNKSRKEKNKLASRACRLKKKAQHEANKVKLQGLEMEQQRLTEVIEKVRKEIIIKGSSPVAAPKPSLSGQVESLIKATFGNQLVAGHTSDFVHSVLKATARENPSLGELDELSLCF